MQEKRKFQRCKTHLKAHYFLKEQNNRWGKCTIVDIGPKGLGIVFRTPEKIDVGTTVLLEVPLHTGMEPVYVMGMLKWVMPNGKDFVGGIESTELLTDLKLYYSPMEK